MLVDPRLRLGRREVLLGGASGLASLLVPAGQVSACFVHNPLQRLVLELRQRWGARDGSLAGRVFQSGQPWTAAEDTRPDRCGELSTFLTSFYTDVHSGAIILLGEVHDNPEHHVFRALLTQNLQRLAPSAGTLSMASGSAAGEPVAAGPPADTVALPHAGGLAKFAAIAFEQIRADQQSALDKFADFNAHAARLGHSGDLKQFLAWDKSPWSKMADYTPLFDAAISARLPIYAADPPRDVMRKAAKEGLTAAIPAEERTRLGLDTPLGDAQDAASLAEIDGSHCGMIPKSAQPNMAQAQRYRDAYMADVMLKGAAAHGSAILIAGNGHVRTDRGVPWYIRSRAPGTKVVSVMLIEVIEGQNDPEAYIPRDPDGKPAAGVIIFTPPGPDRDTDPCDTMKPPAK